MSPSSLVGALCLALTWSCSGGVSSESVGILGSAALAPFSGDSSLQPTRWHAIPASLIPKSDPDLIVTRDRWHLITPDAPLPPGHEEPRLLEDGSWLFQGRSLGRPIASFDLPYPAVHGVLQWRASFDRADYDAGWMVQLLSPSNAVRALPLVQVSASRSAGPGDMQFRIRPSSPWSDEPFADAAIIEGVWLECTLSWNLEKERLSLLMIDDLGQILLNVQHGIWPPESTVITRIELATAGQRQQSGLPQLSCSISQPKLWLRSLD